MLHVIGRDHADAGVGCIRIQPALPVVILFGVHPQIIALGKRELFVGPRLPGRDSSVGKDTFGESGSGIVDRARAHLGVVQQHAHSGIVHFTGVMSWFGRLDAHGWAGRNAAGFVLVHGGRCQ